MEETTAGFARFGATDKKIWQNRTGSGRLTGGRRDNPWQIGIQTQKQQREKNDKKPGDVRNTSPG